jgi:tetratricopeptide (TPR) repeat protein
MTGVMRVSLILVSVLGVTACSTAYKPAREVQQQLALQEARATVQSGANGFWIPIENGVRVERIDPLYSGLRIVPRTGKPQLCRYREFVPVMDIHHLRLGNTVELRGCKIKSKYSSDMYLGYDFKPEQARKLTDAIFVLQQHYRKLSGPDTQEQSEKFEAAVRQYRASALPTVLPEAALALEHQAEVAANENRVDDAIGLYTLVLDTAPAWPDGYYRRGTLNAEIGEYAAAIRDLNKYLKLEPDTQDARTAKTLIYQWQSKLLASKSGR